MTTEVPAQPADMQRLASVAQVGGFRPPSTPKSSWIASVLLGAPGETWPESNGRPMCPLCQILTEELPAAAPAPLREVLGRPAEAGSSAGIAAELRPPDDALVRAERRSHLMRAEGLEPPRLAATRT